MHVAYLINQYPKVSHSFIRREIQALERRGVKVDRIALRGWDGDIISEDDRNERDQTRYVQREGWFGAAWSFVALLAKHPLRVLRTVSLVWRMGRRAERPMLVHFAYLAEASIVLRWLKQTNVQHLHAHFGTNSAEVAMLVHELGGPSWSVTVHGPEEFDKKHLIGLTEKINRCSFAVAISSFGRSQLYRCVAHKHWPKIHVVHCGVESSFHAAHSDPTVDAKTFVCVGRLCEQKGQFLLIEAARRLAADGDKFNLVLAGDGEMRAVLDELIVRYQLQDSVRITGWINSDQVRDEILASRALVLPSFAEGLPVVLMEAMVLRRPVISTFVAGIPELVRPVTHGWLIPAGDVEALVQAMRACLYTPIHDLLEMGKAGRKAVLAAHDVDIEAEKLALLFQTYSQADGIISKL